MVARRILAVSEGELEKMSSLTGGQIVARTLRDLGAQSIFSVSGNQILSIYDAVGACDLQIFHMRHESAAAYAAAASAEIKNQPGIALVSAGPAFVAALAGVAAVRSMEVPLLFLSGASATTDANAGGFQDFDQRGAARTVCKTSIEVTAVGQIRTALSQAWELAQLSIPGPVHVSLPVDVLLASSSDQPIVQDQPSAPFLLSPHDEAVLQAVAQQLTQAQRPLIIARPSAARGEAGRALWRIARHLQIEPVITECPRGLRDLKYSEIIRHYSESDAVLVIAPADFAVGFLVRSTIASQGRLFLIDAPEDPRPRRPPDLHMQIPPELALRYLEERITGPGAVTGDWMRLWSHPAADETLSGPSSGDGLHPLEVAAYVRSVLRPDDVIVLDGGEFGQWVRLGLRDIPNRVLWNSKFGGIGGSIPMAIGVSATGHAGRTIVLLGDGAAGYHLSEFETAVRYAIPFVAIIGNDARWAAEWFQQVNRYGPERTFETTLSRARYDQAAVGLGAGGTHVTDTATLDQALTASMSTKVPVCLNVHIRSLRSPAVEA